MSSPQKPKLADQLRSALRLRGYSYRTEQSYVQWYTRFVRFHHLRHPADMGQAEVEAFLSHLATDLQVSASTQNQALAALLFLYAEVLKQPLGNVNALRANQFPFPRRSPANTALPRRRGNGSISSLLARHPWTRTLEKWRCTM